MHNLGARLKTVLRSVPKNAAVADIGTDHAFLPIELIKSGKATKVIACDVNEKPLQNAKRNIEKYGISNIELRLSDGLEKVNPHEVNTITIAGMGGDLIADIISRAEWLKDTDKTLVLQPMSSADSLRKYLYNNGFKIISETAVYDANRVYSVLLVQFDGNVKPVPLRKIFIGELEHDLSTAATDYIKRQYNKLTKLSNDIKGIEKLKKQYDLSLNTANDIKTVLDKR